MTSHGLARNIVYNVVGQGISIAVGFLAVRFIFRDLGSDEVGLIFFAISAGAALSNTMDLGLSSTVVRATASDVDTRIRRTEGLIRTAGLIYWAIFAFLTVSSIWLAPLLVSKWLNLGSLDVGTAETSLRVLFATVFLAIPRSLYASIFKGRQQMGFVNAVDVGMTIAQQLGIALVIGLGGGVVAVSLWIATIAVIWLGTYAVAISRTLSAQYLMPAWDSSAFRLHSRFASQLAIVSVLATIHTQADKLAISRLLPLGWFGLYAVAYTTLARGMLFTAAVSQAALPALARLEASGDRAGLFSQYRNLHDLVSFSMIPVFAAVPFFSTWGFSLIFGPEEAQLLFLPSTFLALGFFMNATMNMPHMLALARGKPEIVAALNAWALLTILPLTVTAVWLLGLLGAGLSWVAYHVFAYAYAVPRIIKACGNGDVRGWFIDLGRFVSAATVVYGTCWLAGSLGGGTPLMLAASYGVATLVYAVIGWRLIPTDVRRMLQPRLLWQTPA